ncbi:PREDICTED: Bardet-Biedl syndrome 5 protein homolog isoform X2 [Polistes dominula]|uniref:Bardet-Biedl syndrome 5 protein homolog isoform X2 n=1 Tax=Polistes dominula TaxID=743375 RepID=A0ABM1JDB6_POLDO|nr:PREDICTED: Bardet-Biedl syndrome 5 protein homolog isoform X2 [Polistes dominula]
MWQDKEIRFDVFYNQMQLRAGEMVVDKLDLIEDTKGNSGDNGRLIVTNLRILWHSLSLPRINLSIGFNTFVTINSKTIKGGYTQALHILTSFRNSQYEFIFTNLDSKSTRHYTSVIGVYRAYTSSKIYREIKLRSGIINENRLTLLPHEKVQSSSPDVWNLSVEQGNVGTLIVTNIRLVWFADMNNQFNVSIPYLSIASVTIRNSKFGPTLVVLSDENNGGYILGFRINPIQKLNTLHKEINILVTAYNKSPIFGVDYTLEYQGPMEEEIHPERFNEIQDNQADISDVFGYYFFEGGFTQRKANFSNYLGLAIEDPREGSTLQNLWELVPST